MVTRTLSDHVRVGVEGGWDALYALLSSLPCGGAETAVEVNGTRYEIVRVLGEGGFSMVYLARDPTGQLYALKKVGTALTRSGVRTARHRYVKRWTRWM